MIGDTNIAKISIVGAGMRSHAGVASLMFETLAEEGVNIQMISTSEIKISCVVDDKIRGTRGQGASRRVRIRQGRCGRREVR